MLSEAVRNYVALRRAVGFQIRVVASLLERFAAFATAAGETHVRTPTVLAWSAAAPSVGQRIRRLEVVRRFARHAALEDPRHEIPPSGVYGHRALRRTPHIFADAEVSRIVAAAAALPPHGGLRPATYATLFGLIASTGLRVSEALRLDLHDVTADGLVVRETKFRKSRLVPLHATTRDALSLYVTERTKFPATDPAVFISGRGRRFAYPTVISTFLAIIRALGLRAPRGRGPHLHDLRHTFAVRSLERCAAGREVVARHALALSTYLGHAHIADTYWYLHATPELLVGIAAAAEAMHQGAS